MHLLILKQKLRMVIELEHLKRLNIRKLAAHLGLLPRARMFPWAVPLDPPHQTSNRERFASSVKIILGDSVHWLVREKHFWKPRSKYVSKHLLL